MLICPASSKFKLGFDSKPNFSSSVFSICNALSGEAKLNLRGIHMADKCGCKGLHIFE